MVKVIGLTGKAGAGKDYVAKQVLRPLGFQNVAYAWPLKMAGMAAGFTFEEVFQTKPPHVRQWLQGYGVQQRLQRGPDFWIGQLDVLMQVLRREGGVRKFVVTDVRFPNEAEFIHLLGGKVIRVSSDRPYPLAGTPAAQHISETALDGHPVDVELWNGTGVTADTLREHLVNFGVLSPKHYTIADNRQDASSE